MKMAGRVAECQHGWPRMTLPLVGHCDLDRAQRRPPNGMRWRLSTHEIRARPNEIVEITHGPRHIE